MAHGGQEYALGFVGGLGFILGPPSFLYFTLQGLALVLIQSKDHAECHKIFGEVPKYAGAGRADMQVIEILENRKHHAPGEERK